MSTWARTGIYIRVNNVYGDFSHAVLDTVRDSLQCVKPLLGFDVSQQHDQLYFIPVFIEQEDPEVFHLSIQIAMLVS